MILMSWGMLSSFLSCHEELLEGIEALLPESAVELEPLRGVAQGPGIETDSMNASFHASRDQTGVLEDDEVLGDGVERDLVWLGDLRDGGVAEGQAREDVAARGVGESGEGLIEIFNQSVE